jgi:hypothetical protein
VGARGEGRRVDGGDVGVSRGGGGAAGGDVTGDGRGGGRRTGVAADERAGGEGGDSMEGGGGAAGRGICRSVPAGTAAAAALGAAPAIFSLC